MRREARFVTTSTWLAMALLLAVLGGCGNQDEVYPPNTVYRVTMVNLTYNQYFAPVGVIVHTGGYQAWTLGAEAEEQIERLAEGGQLAQAADSEPGKWLLTEAGKDPAVVLTKVMVDTSSGQAIGLLGGRQAQVSLSVPPGQDYRLTVATGMMFTNDGFTGVTDVSIGQLGIGESLILYTNAYDAGTEANTETELTVYGFALFNEKEAIGYDPARDDAHDYITLHAGVITHDEPLGDSSDQDLEELRDGSGLNETHRFLQPVAKIIVERVS